MYLYVLCFFNCFVYVHLFLIVLFVLIMIIPYDISNIIYIFICLFVYCAFVGQDNKLYKMDGTYIKMKLTLL